MGLRWRDTSSVGPRAYQVVDHQVAPVEPEDEYGGGGVISPYEDLGRKRVAHLEARERAVPGSVEREEAEAALKRFLGQTRARLPEGRQAAGASDGGHGWS